MKQMEWVTGVGQFEIQSSSPMPLKDRNICRAPQMKNPSGASKAMPFIPIPLIPRVAIAKMIRVVWKIEAMTPAINDAKKNHFMGALTKVHVQYPTICSEPQMRKVVILSGVAASLREAATESKDPCVTMILPGCRVRYAFSALSEDVLRAEKQQVLRLRLPTRERVGRLRSG
jgi:hypothetical protein